MAGQIGLRVILTMTNFYLEFGGIRWYVDHTVGTAAPPEYFYTMPGPIAAYQTWVRPAWSQSARDSDAAINRVRGLPPPFWFRND